MLLACCWFVAVNGSIQSHVVGSLVPVHIVVLFLVTLTFVLSNMTLQSSSHNFETETKECLERPGRTNPLAACWLRLCTWRQHCVLVFSVAPLGNATVMLFFVGIH